MGEERDWRSDGHSLGQKENSVSWSFVPVSPWTFDIHLPFSSACGVAPGHEIDSKLDRQWKLEVVLRRQECERSGPCSVPEVVVVVDMEEQNQPDTRSAPSFLQEEEGRWPRQRQAGASAAGAAHEEEETTASSRTSRAERRRMWIGDGR